MGCVDIGGSARARGHRSHANAGAAASRTGRASPPAGAAVVGERPQPDAILALTDTSQEAASVGDLWRVSQGELEPMPFLGDTMFLHILNQMGRAHPAVYERSVLDPERPFSDRLAITQTGREVPRA